MNSILIEYFIKYIVVYILISSVICQMEYRSQSDQKYYEDGSVYQPFYTTDKISKRIGDIGVIAGRSIVVGLKSYINVFKGIPYAQPPYGDLRFQKPRPPKTNWGNSRTRELDCTQFRDACPQQLWLKEHLMYNRYNNQRNMSEDCLHMNVFSPNRTEDKFGPRPVYPVLIFIHGEDYSTGDAQFYPGYLLAERKIVVVTFNYRLGVLGFLSTADQNSHGNYGLWDIVQLLEFVQKYISAFAGDPNQITLVGSGSGASSIGLLMVSPRVKKSTYNNQPLFHQVILMAGSELCDWAFITENNGRRSLEYAYDLGRMVGCDVEGYPTKVLIDCLHGKHHEELVNASANVWRKEVLSINHSLKFGELAGPFAPTLDGPDGLFPATPLELHRRGDVIKVDMIAGITLDEGAYLAQNITEKVLGLDMTKGLNEGTFRDIVRRVMRRRRRYRPETEELTSAVVFQYTYWARPDNTSATRQKLIDMYSDMYYGTCVDETLKTYLEYGSDIYMYVFDHRSEYEPMAKWMVRDLLGQITWQYAECAYVVGGAPHGKDVEYLFSYPFFNLTIGNITGLQLDQTEWSHIDRNISEYIVNLFCNFTVNSKNVRLWERNVSWIPMNTNNLTYLWIKEHSELGYNFRQNQYSFWREYLPSLASKHAIITTLRPTVLPAVGYQLATWLLLVLSVIGCIICVTMAISLWKRRRPAFFSDIFS